MDPLLIREVTELASTKEDAWDRVDKMEAAMLAMGGFGKEGFPTKEIQTPGLYSRMIFIPAGTWGTSEIHATRHQYELMQGTVSVWTYETGWTTIEALHVGITEPGTRRVLFAHDDCIWITHHPGVNYGEMPLEDIYKEIWLPKFNPYIEQMLEQK